MCVRVCHPAGLTRRAHRILGSEQMAASLSPRKALQCKTLPNIMSPKPVLQVKGLLSMESETPRPPKRSNKWPFSQSKGSKGRYLGNVGWQGRVSRLRYVQLPPTAPGNRALWRIAIHFTSNIAEHDIGSYLGLHYRLLYLDLRGRAPPSSAKRSAERFRWCRVFLSVDRACQCR